jgi:hypothetical protein
MKKTEAIAFARKLGWTKADAERAYEELKVDFPNLQATFDYYKNTYGMMMSLNVIQPFFPLF